MSIVNTIGSKSSLTPTILVTAPTGSTVTCDGTQGTESSGKWRFKVPIKQSVNPAWKGLPSGYTQLDSVTGSSSALFDTGVYATQSTSIECRGTLNSSQEQVFGGESSYATNAFHNYIDESRFDIGYGGSNYRLGYTSCKAGDEYTITTDKNVWTYTINSTELSYTFTTDTFTSPNSIYLLGLNRGTTKSGSTASMAYCKIKDDSTVIREYIPCKNSSNVVGFYDLINNEFTSPTGGTFTAGDEVSQYIYTPYTIVATSSDQTKTKTVSVTVDAVALFQVSIEYLVPTWLQECEYIQSSGSQFIDANYYPNEKSVYETKFKTEASTSDTLLFGSRKESGNQYDNSIWINTSTNKGIGGHLCTSSSSYADSGWVFTDDIINTERTIQLGNTVGLYVDETQVYSPPSYSSYTSIYSLYIFGINSYGGSTRLGKFTIDFFTIKEGSTLVRNLIPTYAKESHTAYKGSTEVTCSAGAVGLYDLVNDRFYINSGSGTDFTKGDDV